MACGAQLFDIAPEVWYITERVFTKSGMVINMNRQEMDVLLCIAQGCNENQRALARMTGHSLGVVNRCLHTLAEAGYLNEADGRLTSKARELLENSRPSGAVILAAGYGMRMAPIGTEVPKGLLEVRGERLIERLIRQLQAADVTDISVVVGFKKEAFEYLMDEFGVKLVVNPEYGTRNNLYSLLRAKEKLGGSYLLPCDLWCAENPFRRYELYSWYMVSDAQSEESDVRITRARELAPAKPGQAGARMVGIAYFTPRDGEALRKSMETLEATGLHKNDFWEAALFAGGQPAVAARVVRDGAVSEINTYEELKELDGASVHLRSEALQAAASALGASVEEIRDIEVLKKGMTNRSFLFSCRGKRYIMRVPGEGTERLIDRAQEAQVYRAIAGRGLCDDPVYLDPDTGFKITAFLEGARSCDSASADDLRRCMKKLRKFHEIKLQVGHTFDIFAQIDFYEGLWAGVPSVYRDYETTKANVLKLRPYIEAHAGRKVLTHIDAVPDNFLFYPDGAGEALQLTDWEYAGMQDPHVDIAMFCIYAMYDKKQVDTLISMYFEGDCPRETRLKIYCYIAACGLLWSNWCEFKRNLGVEFGEYSLRQYRYAKEYFRLFRAQCPEGLPDVQTRGENGE